MTDSLGRVDLIRELQVKRIACACLQMVLESRFQLFVVQQ